MKYIQKFDLPYLELGEDENLYDDVDLSASDLIPAQYRLVAGYEGNPDICALPRISTTQEIQIQHTIPLTGYDEKKIQNMTVGERKAAILKIRDVRFPFPFHARIDQYLNSCIVNSYAKRRIGVTVRPDGYEVGKEKMEARCILGNMDISGNAIGFSIIGAAGSGKSTGFQMVSEKYPKAIVHDLPDCRYVQIPIMRLVAFANGNLGALYQMFGRQLDDILDSGYSHYGEIRSMSNLGRMTELIITWIKRYHIGIIVIDEIQLMDFSSNSGKSIENLLTITQMTGVPLCMIGTEDVQTNWNRILRLSRRTEGLLVKSDEYCSQRDFFEILVKKIWKYQWLKNEAKLTEEIVQAFYEETMGSIDMLELLWMMIQYEAISRRSEPEITEEYIRKIAKQKFGHMQILLKDSLEESGQKYLDERQSVLDGLKAAMEAEKQKQELDRMRADKERSVRDHYDRDVQMAAVVDSIRNCYDQYSELMIRRAYAKAEKEEEFTRLSRRDATKRVLEYLKQPVGHRRKAEEKKTEKKPSSRTAEELAEELSGNLGYNGTEGPT